MIIMRIIPIIMSGPNNNQDNINYNNSNISKNEIVIIINISLHRA